MKMDVLTIYLDVLGIIKRKYNLEKYGDIKIVDSTSQYWFHDTECHHITYGNNRNEIKNSASLKYKIHSDGFNYGKHHLGIVVYNERTGKYLFVIFDINKDIYKVERYKVKK